MQPGSIDQWWPQFCKTGFLNIITRSDKMIILKTLLLFKYSFCFYVHHIFLSFWRYKFTGSVMIIVSPLYGVKGDSHELSELKSMEAFFCVNKYSFGKWWWKSMLLTFRPELNEVYQGSVNFQPKEVFGLVEKHEIAHMKAGSQEKGKQEIRDTQTLYQLLGQGFSYLRIRNLCFASLTSCG